MDYFRHVVDAELHRQPMRDLLELQMDCFRDGEDEVLHHLPPEHRSMQRAQLERLEQPAAEAMR
jgi:hypothetical protein